MDGDDETTLLGEVNVDFVSRRVWLVKLPEFLANEWKEKGADQDLGKVKVTQNSVSIITQTGEHSIPDEYTIQLQQPPPDNPMFIFSETNDGKSSSPLLSSPLLSSPSPLLSLSSPLPLLSLSLSSLLPPLLFSPPLIPSPLLSSLHTTHHTVNQGF
jgi:hypothetical protein